jgi:hypothetical protein
MLDGKSRGADRPEHFSHVGAHSHREFACSKPLGERHLSLGIDGVVADFRIAACFDRL